MLGLTILQNGKGASKMPKVRDLQNYVGSRKPDELIVYSIVNGHDIEYLAERRGKLLSGTQVVELADYLQNFAMTHCVPDIHNALVERLKVMVGINEFEDEPKAKTVSPKKSAGGGL